MWTINASLIFFTIASVFTVCYVIMIIAFIVGWFKIKHVKANFTSIYNKPISIIIAARNEQDNIYHVVTSILNQSYSAFKLIVVDDNSTDSTLQILNSFDDSRLFVTSADGMGKKRALMQAMNHVDSDYVVCTDADVQLDNDWLLSIMKAVVSSEADMFILPVCINSSYPVQALEFLSLQASTAGSSGIGMPIMCNGANLAFKRELFEGADLKLDCASGDDMFLLESAKRLNSNIVYVKDFNAIARINGAKSFKEFILQRARWASKAGRYSDKGIIISGGIVGIVNLLMAVCLPLCFVYNELIIVVLGKLIFDVILIALAAKFFKQIKLVGLSLVCFLVYPYYVIVCGFVSLLRLKWKN